MSAPTYVTVSLNANTYTVSDMEARLPPVAIRAMLGFSEKFEVDPKTVDVTKATREQSAFGISVASTVAAHTLKRAGVPGTIEEIVRLIEEQVPFETLLDVLEIAKRANPRVFSGATATASATAGTAATVP